MRTSLNKIQTIENFLNGKLSSEDELVFEALLLVDSTLAHDVLLQRETYRVVTAYNRAKLKGELTVLHQKLINDPSRKSFWDSVFSIFQKD